MKWCIHVLCLFGVYVVCAHVSIWMLLPVCEYVYTKVGIQCLPL